MIVCSCNVLSEATIRDAITRAPRVPTRVVDVYHGLGCRAKCGRCASTVRGLMGEAAAAGAGSDSCVESFGGQSAAAA